MTEIAGSPNLSTLDIPIDIWTQPFWDAANEGRLLLPQCSTCQRFRWPPGPFCPYCQSQCIDWVPSGPGFIYTFTIVRSQNKDELEAAPRVPALIEFPEVDNIRFPAAIVDTPLSDINIGAEVKLTWLQAANVKVPAFRVQRN